MDTSTIEAAQVVALPPATAALFENFYRKKSSQITDSVSNLSKGEFPLGVLFFLSCWKFFWIFGSSGPEESGGNSTKKNTPAAGLRHPVLRRIWSTGGNFRSPQDWCRVYPGSIGGGYQPELPAYRPNHSMLRSGYCFASRALAVPIILLPEVQLSGSWRSWGRLVSLQALFTL